MIVLDVKPWDDETDMEALKKNVLAIEWLCAIGALNQREEKSSPQIEALRTEFSKLGANIHQETPMQELIEKAYAFLWG